MKTKFFLLVMSILFVMTGVHANPPEEGKTIFMSRCAGCHHVNKVLTGPALAGVQERHSIEWLVRFVQSSQRMIQSGDKDAVALYQQFNHVSMPDHPDLTESNIKDIIDYIRSATVASDDKAPFAKPAKLQTVYQPLSLERDYLVFGTYLLVACLLIALLLFVVRFNSSRYRAEEKQTDP